MPGRFEVFVEQRTTKKRLEDAIDHGLAESFGEESVHGGIVRTPREARGGRESSAQKQASEGEAIAEREIGMMERPDATQQ